MHFIYLIYRFHNLSWITEINELFHDILICWDAPVYFKKHRPSDETLNQGPDSLWSLKIPLCPSKKSRGVPPASWPNSPTGLWPSWPPNNPHTLIGFITVFSSPISWCVVGVLAHYGCRRIIQVDAAHWWWMRREIPPLLCKALRVPRKAPYKCNGLLLNIFKLLIKHNAGMKYKKLRCIALIFTEWTAYWIKQHAV